MEPNNAIFTIGLTGGIGSGKSSVTKTLEKLGIPIVDADIVAREVVQPGSPALTALSTLLDDSILLDNGELDRARLRQIIFDNPAIRKRVESILHPAIRKRSNELIQQYAQAGELYVVCAVPLLIEAGLTDLYDRIVVIDVPVEIQIQRIMLRDNCSHSDATKILESQTSRQKRLSVADDIINNDGTLQELELQVVSLHKKHQILAEEYRKNLSPDSG